MKPELKGKRFQDVEDIEKNDGRTERCSFRCRCWRVSNRFKRFNKCIQVVLLAHGACLSIHIISGILERLQPSRTIQNYGWNGRIMRSIRTYFIWGVTNRLLRSLECEKCKYCKSSPREFRFDTFPSTITPSYEGQFELTEYLKNNLSYKKYVGDVMRIYFWLSLIRPRAHLCTYLCLHGFRFSQRWLSRVMYSFRASRCKSSRIPAVLECSVPHLIVSSIKCLWL
jgi:hypothetical protein